MNFSMGHWPIMTGPHTLLLQDIILSVSSGKQREQMKRQAWSSAISSSAITGAMLPMGDDVTTVSRHARDTQAMAIWRLIDILMFVWTMGTWTGDR